MNDEAVSILDNVISVVKEHGFSAEHYDGMTACYIGLSRRMAGLRPGPAPVEACQPDIVRAGAQTCDPGTPLAAALSAIDAGALAHQAASKDDRVRMLPIKETRFERPPGRTAEYYGLRLVRDDIVPHEEQAPIALEVLQAARARLTAESTVVIETPTKSLLRRLVPA